MGAFLAKPVTDKVSVDEEHSRLNFGVCSMQGWRFTQEDNHSCFPSLDGSSSLFGVYDGHGGAEVSRYVSTLLPGHVLGRECWGEGEVGKALSEAFLALDAHLGSRKGLRALKRMAAEDDAALDRQKDKKDKSSADDDGESEDGSEENVRNLFKEAKMPLEMLMAKYGQALAASRNAAEAQDAAEGSPTGSKRTKGSNAATSATDEGSAEAAAEEGGSSTASKKDDAGGGAASEDAPKENGLPDDQPEATNANSAKNGASGGRSKLRSRPNRIVMTDEDDDDDEDSSDEEYDENSSSLVEEEGDGESSGEEDEEDDDDDDDDDKEEDLERSITTSDEFALNMLQGPGLDSGCTAVVAVVRSGGALYVANAGDSRCILSRNGQAVDMSVDHKPEDDVECTRIREAGGEVTSEGRVNGGLNLSRALGDHAYKQATTLGARKQMISALPDVRRVQLRKDEDEFMVLACDGIWNSMTSQDVVDFVRLRLYKDAPLGNSPSDLKERRKVAEGTKLSQICGQMFDTCLAPNTSGDGTGCDNMTAILVTFREPLWDAEEVKKGKEKEGSDSVAKGAAKEAEDTKTTATDVKVKDGDQKEEEDDHGIVLLTPPPSPAAVAMDDDDEEESSEEEEEEEEVEEGEENDEEDAEEADPEEGGKASSNGKGHGEAGDKVKGGARKRATETSADAGVTLKKRKLEEEGAKEEEGGEGEEAVSAS